MTREGLIGREFSKDMRLLEIGPSYNPVLPKRDGWLTTIIDHADQAELMRKYADLGSAMVDRIEAVDFIWQQGSLSEVIPHAMRGGFDGLVASHVVEHFPDLIGFFTSASMLLKADAVMALALPDKRVCFDFFQPLTMTGDVLAAHLEGRTRHPVRTLFNQAAYEVYREGRLGWAHTDHASPLALARPFAVARQTFEIARQTVAADYQDSHAWAFTPASFELLILELNALGQIDWSIRAIEPAPAVEFYAWLERTQRYPTDDEIDQQRLSLLLRIASETADAWSQVTDPPIASVEPRDQSSHRGIWQAASNAVSVRLNRLSEAASSIKRPRR